MRLGALIAPSLLALAFAAPPAAGADSGVAALQVALRAQGRYAGSVDGYAGPATAKAVRAFQARAGLVADGIAGPRTRAALGRFGRPRLGARVIARGHLGWDVAQLQFELAAHGWPSGTFDGDFGAHTDAALRNFQRWAGLFVDGRAGPATLRALRGAPPSSPLSLAAPLGGAVTDRFGPRGARFHTGIDYPAAAGTPVAAARAGRVVFAGWDVGGFGYLVRLAHGSGVTSMYAHLSRIDVRLAQRVALGARVGLVGATGIATGPHLHFEVRVRGAAVDPLPALR